MGKMYPSHLLHMKMDREGKCLWRITCEDPTHSNCHTLDEQGNIVAEDKCFLLDWFSDVGEEMLGFCDWPDDPQFPLPVTWRGDSDNPIIIYDLP